MIHSSQQMHEGIGTATGSPVAWILPVAASIWKTTTLLPCNQASTPLITSPLTSVSRKSRPA